MKTNEMENLFLTYIHIILTGVQGIVDALFKINS